VFCGACLGKTIYQKEKYQNFYDNNNCLKIFLYFDF